MYYDMSMLYIDEIKEIYDKIMMIMNFIWHQRSWGLNINTEKISKDIKYWVFKWVLKWILELE
jgi:hypothetical protein